jgi:hypothetical protein
MSISIGSSRYAFSQIAPQAQRSPLAAPDLASRQQSTPIAAPAASATSAGS